MPKQPDISSKDWLATLLLSIFAGALGIDRFYIGRWKSAILKLVLCFFVVGLIWWIFDIIWIAEGRMRDKEGKFIRRKN